MSLEMQTLVPSLQDLHIHLWLSRMAELGMLCAVNPAFSFVTHMICAVQTFDSGLCTPRTQWIWVPYRVLNST